MHVRKGQTTQVLLSLRRSIQTRTNVSANKNPSAAYRHERFKCSRPHRPLGRFVQFSQTRFHFQVQNSILSHAPCLIAFMERVVPGLDTTFCSRFQARLEMRWRFRPEEPSALQDMATQIGGTERRLKVSLSLLALTNQFENEECIVAI